MSNEIEFIKTILTRDHIEIAERSQHGIQYKTLKFVLENRDLETEEWAEILNISTRTLQRKRREKKGLESPATQRLFSIEEAIQLGIEVFGSEDKCIKWLRSENLSFGNKQPLDFLRTEKGTQMVIDELTRIEHGVLA